jgi:uncharacterized protein
MPDDAQPAELRELDRDACLTLVATQQVGRLVLAGDVPFVVPVNYVLADGALLFRTDSGSRAAATHGEVVVFEVDVVDAVGHAGWSVIVRGAAEDVTERAAADSDLRNRLAPWAPGPKDRWMRVSMEEVTGRWVRGAAQPWAPDERGYL